MAKRRKKKRTGLGTGEGCMGLNIKDQKNCPFASTQRPLHGQIAEDVFCNLNGYKDCDRDNCKLKEFGRIIVDWSK
jgi:hypothetical protein